MNDETDRVLANIDAALEPEIPDWLAEYEKGCLGAGGEVWQAKQLEAARLGGKAKDLAAAETRIRVDSSQFEATIITSSSCGQYCPVCANGGHRVGEPDELHQQHVHIGFDGSNDPENYVIVGTTSEGASVYFGANSNAILRTGADTTEVMNNTDRLVLDHLTADGGITEADANAMLAEDHEREEDLFPQYGAVWDEEHESPDPWEESYRRHLEYITFQGHPDDGDEVCRQVRERWWRANEQYRRPQDDLDTQSWYESAREAAGEPPRSPGSDDDPPANIPVQVMLEELTDELRNTRRQWLNECAERFSFRNNRPLA